MREAQIFSWDNPPEGGHPGEDYNCRCWAEAYYPASPESRQRAIKLRVRAKIMAGGFKGINEDTINTTPKISKLLQSGVA